MCNRLPEINKNGDAGIFPVYYSLKNMIYTTTCATLCHFWCFVFNLSSSCDIGEPDMGSAPLSFLGS